MAAFSKFAGFSYLQANNRIDFYVTGFSMAWRRPLCHSLVLLYFMAA